MTDTLGKLIATIRKETTLHTQDTLARKVGRTKQWLGAIEKGQLIPTLDQLVRLHNEIASRDNQVPHSDLQIWLLKWLEAKAKKDVHVRRETILLAINQLYGHSLQKRKTEFTNDIPTLEHFPDAFPDLVVVCGDRREMPPKRKGDLFVDSFSSSDFASLRKLFERCGPLDIISDKIFAPVTPADNAYLHEKYGGKNLIVIGSPAVNLLARSINKNCVFRFAMSQDVRDSLKHWEQNFPEINDRKLREVLWDMTVKWKGSDESEEIDIKSYCEDYRGTDPKVYENQIAELARKVQQLLQENTAKDFKNFFHRHGFVDPVDTKEQGYFLQDDNDFGVVSMCPNPYSENGNYFCILAAGIHGPGTHMAVRLLATDNFKGHPLGGVIEIKLDLEARWSERFSKADFAWQTGSYEVSDLLRKLGRRKPHSVLQDLDPHDFNNLIDFVKRFAPNKVETK
jgi:DNA-binding XRE family transcriptional regulator